MPLLTLALGFVTFAASLGAGWLTLDALGVRLPPPPWRAVVAVLLGLQLESAIVGAAAMAGQSTRPALIAIWVAFAVVGVVGMVRACRGGALRLAPPSVDWRPHGAREWLPLAIGVASAATNLLVALAPSTKIDELYYHMLLPRRIVADGGLRFYRYPWESAAIPQMSYQIGAAPMHALGAPDATNVASWALGATLLWLGWYLLADDARTRRLAPWWVAAASVGLYTAVWHVTAGAHALGDLALAAAVVLVAGGPRRAGAGKWSPASYALATGVLTWAAASSKATLVPVSAVLLAWGVGRAWRERETTTPSGARPWRALAAAAAGPWLLFGAPLVAWTWHASGAPYGPFLAWRFGHTAYDGEPIRAVLAATATANRTLPSHVPRELIAGHSPLFWIAALAAPFAATALSRSTRAALLGIVVMQAALVFGFVSWDPRFFSGLPFGLALLAALYAPWPRAASRWPAPASVVAAALLVVPWLGVQLYYGAPFVAASLGVTSREQFLTRFVALHADYAALDRALPPDAIVVSRIGRTSAVYAPRPMLFTPRDLASPAERARAYLLTFSCDGSGAAGPVVYTDPRAVVVAYRTPGRANELYAICVRKLEIDSRPAALPGS